MAYKIIKTELAEQDLDNILGYIVLSLANPSAAASFADAVEACVFGKMELVQKGAKSCAGGQVKRSHYQHRK